MSVNRTLDAGGAGGETSDDQQPTDDDETRTTQLRRGEIGETGPRPGGGPADDTSTMRETGASQPDPTTGSDMETVRAEPESSEERRARNQLVAQSEFIDPEDVQFIERGGETIATVDPATRQLLSRAGFTGQVPISEASKAQIREGGLAGETGGGEDLPFASGGQSVEERLVDQATTAVTAALAQSRVDAAGIVNPQLRQAAIEQAEERIDIERGRDFELAITRGPEGIEADVQLTEQRQRSEVAGALEKRLFRQTGVDLQAGEGFTVTEGESGGFEPDLTEAGEQKLATGRTTEAVERLTTGRGLPVTVPGARFLPGVDSDTFILGKGTEVPALTEDAIAMSDPDIGQVDIPIPGTDTTFEQALSDVTAAVSAATDVQDAPLGDETPTGPGVPSALPTGTDFRLTGTARKLVSGAVETPFKLPTVAPLATVGLVKDVGVDFSGEVVGATIEAATTGDTRRLGRIPGSIGQTTTNVAVGATEAFLRDPAVTTGALAASLPVSAGLFKGARAVGPRASLATRGLLQPGEEIAGIGGFRITRRVAGERAAERLFPNEEPLIFSEEAAIRGLRRARARGGDLLRRIEIEPRSGFGSGPQPPRLRIKSETETEFEDELQELLDEAERAAAVRATEARAEERIMREALERGQRARAGMTGEEKLTRTVDTRVRGKTIEREAIEPAVTQSGRLSRQRARMGPRGVQQSAFEARLDTEAATEPELEAELSSEMGRVEIEPLGLVGEDIRASTATQLDQRLRMGIELESEMELEGETESEVDLEAELRRELRARAEAEAEAETEFEFESESEFESEFELEAAADRRRRRQRLDPSTDTGEFEKTFTSPVATASEVLGDGPTSRPSDSVLEGLSEDVLDDS